MDFVDKIRVFVKAGNGGDGCLSFRREKFVAYGGPDGGEGGAGGDVILEADARLTTLFDLTRRTHIQGEDGIHGKGSNKAGKDGEPVVVKIPVGAFVVKNGSPAVDLAFPGMRFTAARGGRGGRGNLSFKNQRNTAPRIREKGGPGESAVLDLELKLLADVGLIGFPNAGKSSLLARLSNARPKIADYPFTTLSPNLGVVSHGNVSFVMADIPGLIADAHLGRGLGIDFLRHIERTRILLHLVDPQGFNGKPPAEGVRIIENELASTGASNLEKPRILVVNKMDLPQAERELKKLSARYSKRGILAVSAATGEGVKGLLDRVILELSKIPPPVPAAEKSEQEELRIPRGFEVKSLGGGVFELQGPSVERAAAMLDQGLPEAVRRFQHMLRRIGVDRALKQSHVREGDEIRCGPVTFEWTDAPARELPRLSRDRPTRIGAS